MSLGPSNDRLECGARINKLLDQVSAGDGDRRDAHQSGCPYCQAALAEYDRLWAPVREVAATEVHAPDSVLEQAIRRIRGTASSPTYGTLPTPTGATRIAARAVVVTARQTAQDIAGVRVALSKLITDAYPGSGSLGSSGPGSASPGRSTAPIAAPSAPRDEGPQVVAGVAGRSTAIEVTLAADYGTDLITLGERIRAGVADRVRDLTGLEPVVITVRIDDLFD